MLPNSSSSQHHPALFIVVVIFFACFVVGALHAGKLHGGVGVIAQGLMAGLAGVFFFALLSLALAFPFTVVPMISRAFRRRSSAVGKAKADSFGRTFMRNLEGAMELWIQGWP